jgi:hypothetical protein
LTLDKEFQYLVFLKEIAKNDIINEIPKAQNLAYDIAEDFRSFNIVINITKN